LQDTVYTQIDSKKPARFLTISQHTPRENIIIKQAACCTWLFDKKVNMGLAQAASAEGVCLSFDSSSQVGEADAMARELLAAFEGSSGAVTLDLGALTQADVTFFQIILAAAKTLRGKKRELMLLAMPPDHIVMLTAALLGIELERYIPMAEAKY
jgi:anti-anti-sigma regulatory factor